MQKNVGTIDATMRLTCGLVGLAWSTAKMARHPFWNMPRIVAFLSAMKVAEGITRFCPMLALMDINTLDKKKPMIAKRSGDNYKI